MKTNIQIIICILFLGILNSSCQSNTKSTNTAATAAKTQSGSVSSEDPDYAKAELMDLGNGYQFGTIVRQSGHIDGKGTFLNGKKDGTWVNYHDRVQDFGPNVEILTTYKEGVKHGTEMIIDAAGRVNELMFYTNGKKQGPHSKYQHTATVDETNYKNGELHGSKKMYYIDGTLQMETTYVDGKRNGIERYYDQQGQVMMETEFVNGVKQKK